MNLLKKLMFALDHGDLLTSSYYRRSLIIEVLLFFFFKKAYRTRHTIREACVSPGRGPRE